MFLHFVFFFNDTATTEIYTLSLHDALPISGRVDRDSIGVGRYEGRFSKLTLVVLDSDLELQDFVIHFGDGTRYEPRLDRKSTRLNSSHANISYAVFCLKKKKIKLETSHSAP